MTRYKKNTAMFNWSPCIWLVKQVCRVSRIIFFLYSLSWWFYSPVNLIYDPIKKKIYLILSHFYRLKQVERKKPVHSLYNERALYTFTFAFSMMLKLVLHMTSGFVRCPVFGRISGFMCQISSQFPILLSRLSRLQPL